MTSLARLLAMEAAGGSAPVRAHGCVHLHTDGGARGNPGPAGIGVVIEDKDGHELDRLAEGIGHATNNVAEYTALIRGLERALALGADQVEAFSDSQLMVFQIQGKYRVRDVALRRLHADVMALVRRCRQFSIRHVPREKNREADKLANLGMDRQAEAARR